MSPLTSCENAQHQAAGFTACPVCNPQLFFPVLVSARRDIKGARRRELAVQTPASRHVGLAWLPNGGVDVYFNTADGMAHVVLPPDVVERIRAAQPRPVKSEIA